MSLSQLERLTATVRDGLESRLATRPSREREGLLHLLRALLSTDVGPLQEFVREEGIRGQSKHLKELEHFLKNQSMLPEAICARYRHSMGETRARRRYRVNASDWDLVHALARETGADIERVADELPYEEFVWHDELENHFVRLEVILEPQALDDMLICALEGFLAPGGKRRRSREVFGISLGMAREEEQMLRGRGRRMTRLVYVMRNQPQLSAFGTHNWIEPSEKGLDVLVNAAQALFPQYQALGDFHSHPYDSFSQLENRRGWSYSPEDEAHNITCWQEILTARRQRAHVSFIVAIAPHRQSTERARFRDLPNTLQVTAGCGCRAVVAAYRILRTGRYSSDRIRLRLPGMID